MEISIKRIRDRHATDQWYPGSVSLNLLGGIGGRSVAQTKPMGFWKNVNSYIDVVFNCDTYIEWEDNYTDIYRDINIYFDTNCLWKIDLENSNLDDTQSGGSGLFVTIYDVSPSIHFGRYSYTDIKAGHGTIRLRASNNYTLDGFNGHLAIQHPDPNNENQLTTTYVNFFLSGLPADPGGEFYADPNNFNRDGTEETLYLNLVDAANTPTYTSKPSWVENINIGALSGNVHDVNFLLNKNIGAKREGNIVFNDGSTNATVSVRQSGVQEGVMYGYLYNWFAATSPKGIANGAEWRLPSVTDINHLTALAAEYGERCRALKSDRTKVGYPIVADPVSEHPKWEHWEFYYGTDNVNFTAYPSGIRHQKDGIFRYITRSMYLWTSDEVVGSENVYAFYLHYYLFATHEARKRNGLNIRLVRNATSAENSNLSTGDLTDNYTGNDGTSYQTIYIKPPNGEGVVWLREHLAETKYADNTDIPLITGAAEWLLDTSGARCAYGNHNDYVFF